VTVWADRPVGANPAGVFAASAAAVAAAFAEDGVLERDVAVRDPRWPILPSAPSDRLPFVAERLPARLVAGGRAREFYTNAPHVDIWPILRAAPHSAFAIRKEIE
jgi:hypothetical protein